MKAIGHGLWAVGSEARYVRMLSSGCASVSAQGISNHKKIAPRWQTNEKTLHLVLATAYSLQPIAWWSSR
jgi:hypothetical protein